MPIFRMWAQGSPAKGKGKLAVAAMMFAKGKLGGKGKAKSAANQVEKPKGDGERPDAPRRLKRMSTEVAEVGHVYSCCECISL